jgi:hypothetical protein
MIIKATGRSALIVATGLFVCFAGPSRATDDTTASSKSQSTAPVVLSKFTKHSAHHGKSYAHRKSSTVAEKPSDKSDKKDAPADVAADDSDNSSAIPPTVANANAQMASSQVASNQVASNQAASSDVPGGNAKAMSARASEIVQANPAGAQGNLDSQVVAADQLNDVDRALHESNPPALVMAAADTPDTSATAPAMTSTSSNEGSTWDQTSLIGKIFIGFGALLTMASAARMFMA